MYLDRALVEVVSKVGVVVKRAVTDPYYAHILPYVCGLGPRKAESLIKKIVSSLVRYSSSFLLLIDSLMIGLHRVELSRLALSS